MLAKFGTKSNKKMEERLVGLLDRVEEIDSLAALIAAIGSNAKRFEKLRSSAIGIDSSVLLRLGGSRDTADITDYLASQHEAPIILPGQTIQEFWNNHLGAVDTISVAVTKKFDEIKKETDKLGVTFGDFFTKMSALINDFYSEYGYIYSEATVRTTLSMLQTLKSKAIVPYVQRVRFKQIAEQRKRLKTPPGFKDDGDGDFYVWADFLLGLIQAKDRGKHFDHVVLLTHDKKTDWSRNGIAHPVLAAEVYSLVGTSFELWNIKELAEAIKSS